MQAARAAGNFDAAVQALLETYLAHTPADLLAKRRADRTKPPKHWPPCRQTRRSHGSPAEPGNVTETDGRSMIGAALERRDSDVASPTG
jgi:hypothetical protein